MARPSLEGLTIAKLENLINTIRNKKTDLMKERERLLKDLRKVEAKIAQLDGSRASLGGGVTEGRVRNAKSLVATMEEVLAKAGDKGLSVGDIVDAVKATGYQTSSPNFRGIVNQTLIKERKKFMNVDRGVYAVKGAK
ncbi:MAG: hypothetical protein QM770_10745 [Tepidisphaeraceae bacterium]